jgi:hypothetical protein
MTFLRILGFGSRDNDKQLKALVAKSRYNARVVGRGTVKIDAKEVRQSEEFKKAQLQAMQIVKKQAASQGK